MTANNKTKEVALGDDSGDVAVFANGVRVEIGADGDVKVRPIANDDKEPVAGKTYGIGQHIDGKGVFVGIWTPKDRGGNSLNKTFNLFAAPEDLTDKNGQKVLLTFNEAVKRVADLKDWHGHDGGHYKNDTKLYKALRTGSYNGEWFIPTRDILHGRDVDGNEVQANLYGHKDAGALAGTFTDQSGSGLAHWYWSCTKYASYSSRVWNPRVWNPRVWNPRVWNQSFNVWGGGWSPKAVFELSVRCVRAELRP